jgi:hypothetical protein
MGYWRGYSADHHAIGHGGNRLWSEKRWYRLENDAEAWYQLVGQSGLGTGRYGRIPISPVAAIS